MDYDPIVILWEEFGQHLNNYLMHAVIASEDNNKWNHRHITRRIEWKQWWSCEQVHSTWAGFVRVHFVRVSHEELKTCLLQSQLTHELFLIPFKIIGHRSTKSSENQKWVRMKLKSCETDWHLQLILNNGKRWTQVESERLKDLTMLCAMLPAMLETQVALMR